MNTEIVFEWLAGLKFKSGTDSRQVASVIGGLAEANPITTEEVVRVLMWNGVKAGPATKRAPHIVAALKKTAPATAPTELVPPVSTDPGERELVRKVVRVETDGNEVVEKDNPTVPPAEMPEAAPAAPETKEEALAAPAVEVEANPPAHAPAETGASAPESPAEPGEERHMMPNAAAPNHPAPNTANVRFGDIEVALPPARIEFGAPRNPADPHHAERVVEHAHGNNRGLLLAILVVAILALGAALMGWLRNAGDGDVALLHRAVVNTTDSLTKSLAGMETRVNKNTADQVVAGVGIITDHVTADGKQTRQSVGDARKAILDGLEANGRKVRALRLEMLKRLENGTPPSAAGSARFSVPVPDGANGATFRVR